MWRLWWCNQLFFESVPAREISTRRKAASDYFCTLRILSAARDRPLLERGRSGGRHPFCSGNDLPAGGNHPLHPRSCRGSEFGTQRGTRFAVHGPRCSTRHSRPQSALIDLSMSKIRLPPKPIDSPAVPLSARWSHSHGEDQSIRWW